MVVKCRRGRHREEFNGLSLRAAAMFGRFEEGSQSLVDRLRIRKLLCNIGLQDDKVRAFGEALGVLPLYSLAEVVFCAHLVAVNLLGIVAHTALARSLSLGVS